MEIHTIEPVYDENSEILILGSFPSVKSREVKFFYGHPQNRFWKVLSAVFDDETGDTIEGKKAFLKRNKIALWDVIASCDIESSSDSSIKNVTPNDLSEILGISKIKMIFTNGKASDRLYRKYLEGKTGITAVNLPSTSPANASWKLEKLIEEWKKISQH